MYRDSMPNCVPEYNQEIIERLQHEEELRWERFDHYQSNQKKMDEVHDAGLPVLLFGGYETCCKCGDADYDAQRGEDDDFGCVIYHNPGCPEHKKHKEYLFFFMENIKGNC